MSQPMLKEPQNGVIAGTAYLFRGLPLLKQPGIWPWAVIPLIINILVLGLAAWGIVTWAGGWIEGWVDTLPGWLNWLGSLLYIVLIIAVLLVVFQIFSLMANLIAAPFNGFLSAAVEEKLTGKRPDTGLSLWGEAWVTIRAEIGKFWFLLTRAALVGLVSIVLLVIPGLNALLPVLWFMFGAYMLSLEYLDYPMGNHGMSFRDKRQLLARNRGLALSFGSITTLLTALPLINLLIMPTAVAGATLAWVESLRRTRPPVDHV